jgi:hypothetical protein
LDYGSVSSRNCPRGPKITKINRRKAGREFDCGRIEDKQKTHRPAKLVVGRDRFGQREN